MASDAEFLFDCYCRVSRLAQQTHRLDLALASGHLWAAFLADFAPPDPHPHLTLVRKFSKNR